MGRIKQALTSKPAKYGLAVFIGMILGGSAAAEPQERVITKEVVREVPRAITETKVVYRTPEACKTALQIDNEIFSATGKALASFEFGELNAKLAAEQDRRLQNHNECIAS